MKLIVLIILLGVSLGITAQDKELTLEDAVLGQWRQFYPTRVANLTWRKGQDVVTFHSKDSKQIMMQKVGAKTAQELFDLKALNKAFGEELSRMPFIQWESEQEFSFVYGGQRFWMALEGDNISRKLVVRMPKEANIDYHKKSQNIAYTKAHNLYVQDKNGGELEVTAFEDPNIVSGQAIARYEFGIGKGTFWSPDGSHLAFYQKDETDVADYPLLDITTTPGALKTIKYPMAGQKSEYARVGIFNVATKKTIYLKVDGPKDQYLTNLGWGPENKYVYVAVVNREQNHVWLNQYDVKTGNLVKTLFEEKHDKYVEPEHPVWFIPGNNKEFLWWSERDGFMHLHRYNTEGKYLGQVTKGKWVTLKVLGLDDTKKMILVQGTDESGLNTTVYCAPLEGGKPSKRLVKEDGVHSFSLSSSGKYLIDDYSDIKTPHVTRIVTLKGKVKNTLHTAENPYKDYQISSPELVSLKAKDGTPLQARLIKPANFDPSKKYPVIVYVYGGPHAQMVTNSWLGNARLWMYYAANKGYLVFTLDNRGSANRGLEFENVIHRQLSKHEMEDQLVGVDYLKSLAYADTDRMAVHGWSYGGFMTTSLMLKHPDVFKVGVAGGPVTDWNYYEVMYGERYMDMPKENPEGYKETQLKNHVQNLKGDLLLIHGTVDDVVVMQHNLSLVKAFVDNGILMDFFPYPMHPHNVRGKDRVHLMNKVLTYIDDKLK
ncbi:MULTISPECIES: DPP IV N-terminal domain-containing protein [unclassified Aureispira]|uniref:S9 family peptidase n=1 Tax=unclassified Aureispira TaxID=2649989 RepID=UPI000695F873|nr:MULTISPECIES: DPP IV N-terminal domain-containing protein [unclassified Aureispira]WMX12999.1 DPP IV N-terminal domain-containing protein [Aureispira sp. CCB-E]